MTKFEENYQHLNNEVMRIASSYFSWKSFHDELCKSKKVADCFNDSSYYWSTVQYSLQLTTFISIGRLFDTDGQSFNLNRIINNCIEHIDEFSSESLSKRKGEFKRIEAYIASSYQPEEQHFLRLKGPVSKWRAVYEKKLKPVRNNLLAHSDYSTISSGKDLFGDIVIEDLEGIVLFVCQFRQHLWQLYHNGRNSTLDSFGFIDDKNIKRDFEKVVKKISCRDMESVQKDQGSPIKVWLNVIADKFKNVTNSL